MQREMATVGSFADAEPCTGDPCPCSHALFVIVNADISHKRRAARAGADLAATAHPAARASAGKDSESTVGER